jgi:hypothetical protein
MIEANDIQNDRADIIFRCTASHSVVKEFELFLTAAAPGGTANYEGNGFGFGKNMFGGKFNVLFESGERSKPFMLFILKRDSDNSLSAILPFGVRYPTTNPVRSLKLIKSLTYSFF